VTKTRWIVFAIACLILLGFLVVNSKRDEVDVSKIDPSVLITEGNAADQVYGNKQAKVVLIEYGDFQCPGCGGAFPGLKTIKETYKDQMAFTFRHFPLTSIHPNALAAASTAAAAAKQGKFWEMHDKLYENQTSWQNLSAEQRGNVFKGYAEQLGLNIDQFNTDLTSKEVSEKIAFDRAIAGKLNVTSTPTLYLGKEKLSEEVVSDLIQKDGKLLRDKIEAAIKEAGGTVPEKN